MAGPLWDALRTRWSRDNFAQHYGHLEFKRATVPYAASVFSVIIMMICGMLNTFSTPQRVQHAREPHVGAAASRVHGRYC